MPDRPSLGWRAMGWLVELVGLFVAVVALPVAVVILWEIGNG